MGGFSNISGFGSSGGGSGFEVAGDGNGFLVYVDGMVRAVSLVGVSPISIDNPEGRSGNPIFRGEPYGRITSGRVSGNTLVDQAMKVNNKTKYTINKVIFTAASATPIALQGGVYTRYGKTGTVLVPSTTLFTTLTDGTNGVQKLEIPVTGNEVFACPFIYVSFSVVNAAAVSLSCYVCGEVLEQTYA